MFIVEIMSRIKKHLKTTIDADVARALGVTPQRLNNWPDRNTIPWPELCGFAIKEGISIDWLLTGKAADAKAHPCAGLEEHCPKFKNILYSDHEIIKDAFISNLKAFNYSIEKEKKLEKRISDLEKAMSSGRRTGIETVASSNTGKRET